MSLKKPLGALAVFSIAAGAMVSSGLFVLPGLMFGQVGPAMILSYGLAGVLMTANVLSATELATAMPKAGGTYFFIERGLGPLVGTVAGFAEWFSTALKGAFALVGMGTFATLLLGDLGYVELRLIMAGFCLVFVVLNLLSVKGTGRFQIGMVFVLLTILLAYVGLAAPRIDIQEYTPFASHGWASVLMGAGMVFVSYIGVTKVAGVSEEVRRPGRAIPLGLLSAFGVVSVLYVAVVAATVGLGTFKAGQQTLTPISDAGGVLFGGVGQAVLALAACLAFITTANGSVLAASRVLLAMSRDELLPNPLAAVNRRFGTPHVGILVTGTFMIGALMMKVEDLVTTASTLMLLLFVLINLSLIMMRASKIHSYRPRFRCPGYPWVQGVGIVTCFFLIAGMGTVPLAISGGFAVLGLGWYIFYVPRKVKRQSALVRVVERIVDRRIGTEDLTLESELKDILVERDDIIEDRFDRLIKNCTILDMEGPTDYESFFKSVAYHTSEHLETSSASLYHQLVKREKESTTAVAPGLAIPHVIIPGENKFDILLARCRQGITFQEDQPPVHIAFVLLGTRDERSFHLKSLMWIAQIAQNPGFREQWLEARDEEELRNIILLGAREREAEG
ncbi:MAG: amino acid permease [Planctomycetota bacterium]